jgi:hypothetical protein
LPAHPIHIGVDFDNTIVCYDALFHRVALERGLIPAELPVNKSEVRNYLRRAGKEEIWTEMQGCVYGGRMAEAAPYPGVIEFFRNCLRSGITLSIISHKTRHPFLGEQYDLHEAALNWLELQGFFDPGRIGLPRGSAFFELTREAKIGRIIRQGCTHFIDDLPEVFAEANFPKIGRILFDPGDIYGKEAQYKRAPHWAEIPKLLETVAVPFGTTAQGPSPEAAIRGFLGLHGFSDGLEIRPLTGGGNNRVYEAREGSRRVAVKQYFHHAADRRDRFGAERAFYDFIWRHGTRRTAEPLGWDVGERLGLFSFVEGRKLGENEAGGEAVEQALQFVLDINRARGETDAGQLPPGSEACFSDAEHLRRVNARVERLDQITGDAAVDREALNFVETELRPAWEEFKKPIAAAPELSRELPAVQRVISPSDFGFHNALLGANGRLTFFDFEYAGWDDPAKLVCDFFCQPQIPAPLPHWRQFVDGISSGLELEKTLPARAWRLLTAYCVKWCCIMLNDFVGGDSARRDFARGGETIQERKIAQLAKARKALEETWKLHGTPPP